MPRESTADPEAQSHAGTFDGFEVFWATKGAWLVPDKRGVHIDNKPGWYVGIPDAEEEACGPFETSQAAFGAAKDAIDAILTEQANAVRATLLKGGATFKKFAKGRKP